MPMFNYQGMLSLGSISRYIGITSAFLFCFGKIKAQNLKRTNMSFLDHDAANSTNLNQSVTRKRVNNMDRHLEGKTLVQLTFSTE